MAIPYPLKLEFQFVIFWRSMMKNIYRNPFLTVNPNVAKVEGVAGPRHRGRSCSVLPPARDNAGDAVPSAFPQGKQHDDLNAVSGLHRW